MVGAKIEKIIKRDGRIVKFDPEKIANAIWKAAQAVGGKDRKRAEELAQQVVQLLEKTLKPGEIPTVEQVQDLVEKVLVENGHYKTAKAYILYRQKRAEARKACAILGVKDDLKLPLNTIVILASRYLLRDEQRNIIETTSQLFRRVARAIAEVEKNYGKSEEEVKELEERFYELLTSFKFLPNSPTLMNAGTGKGLTLSACFVIPIEDDMASIFDALKTMALVQKAGGGCIDGNAKIIFENDGELHLLEIKNFYERYRTKEFFDNSFGRWGIDLRDKDVYIYSFDPQTYETRRARVLFAWRYHLTEGIKVRTNKGTEILTSSWHPFFVLTPSFKVVAKRADELNVGDMLIGSTFSYRPKFIWNYWLAGFIAGDSSIDVWKNKRKGYKCMRIRIYAPEKDVLNLINNYLSRGYGRRYSIQRDRNIFYLDIKKKEINDYFASILRGIKDGIPERIKGNKDNLLSFIAGIFDAKGCVNKKPGVEISNRNKKLMEEILYFLNFFGVKARFMEKESKDGKDYLVVIEEKTSIAKFYDLIGVFLKTGKKEKLEKRLKGKGRSFGLNLSFEDFRRIMGKFKIKFKTNGNQTLALVGNETFSLGQWHARGRVSKNKVVGLLEKVKNKGIERLKGVIESLEVVKYASRARGKFTFYDLTLEEYQNYLAGKNGLMFIHNTGFSFSKLRPAGDVVKSTGGIASGPISFMKIFDAATEQIKQGGKRRGANMGILRVDHPDILDFIVCKETEGVLRNFNISVGVTDKFMEAVEKDGEIELINPRNGEAVKRVKARVIWNLMVTMAWKNGEPGVVFLDTINKHNPTPSVGKIEATNPCGEVPLLPYESCNLGSINLSKFVEDGKINWEGLRETVRLAVRFLDNVIDANVYPIKEIEDATKANRKIGLGVMGFADMLIKLGIPYNSEEALETARKVMRFISEEGRKMSEELGKEKGSFPNFEVSIWAKKGYKFMRNATVTTIAPTGTISEIAGCSAGIEPLFAIAYVRDVRESLGYSLTVINPLFELISIERGFYSEKLIEEISKSTSIQHIKEIPEDVRRIFVTALDIEPEWHIRMQAAFQEYVDNAVSKTINLPYTATPADIEKAFMLAWKLGCKGITVYRFGSREYQVIKPLRETCEECPNP